MGSGEEAGERTGVPAVELAAYDDCHTCKEVDQRKTGPAVDLELTQAVNIPEADLMALGRRRRPIARRANENGCPGRWGDHHSSVVSKYPHLKCSGPGAGTKSRGATCSACKCKIKDPNTQNARFWGGSKYRRNALQYFVWKKSAVAGAS